MSGRWGRAIPVEFSIPSDATSRITTIERSGALLLHAQADVPGVNFSDDFEVRFPLTPSSASARSRRRSSERCASRTARRLPIRSYRRAAPANAKVAFTTGMDGSAEFYFRASQPIQVLTLSSSRPSGRASSISRTFQSSIAVHRGVRTG